MGDPQRVDGSGRDLLDGKEFREIEANCWDPAVRLADCDSTSVNVQVLSTVPVKSAAVEACTS